MNAGIYLKDNSSRATRIGRPLVAVKFRTIEDGVGKGVQYVGGNKLDRSEKIWYLKMHTWKRVSDDYLDE